MPDRWWDHALRKVEREGVCRVCRAYQTKLDAAHVYKRSVDQPIGELAYRNVIVVEAIDQGVPAATLYVDPRDVVPLCRRCHRGYDLRRVDLLPYLHLDEQARIVEHIGIERALRRVAPTQWPRD